MASVEDGTQDQICRNGGHQYGPHSKYGMGQRKQIEADWRVAQHAAYLQAEDATRGVMVRKGAPAGVTPESMYPAHPRHRPPLRWTSEELLDFWTAGGQRPMTLGEFRRGMQTEFQHPLEAS